MNAEQVILSRGLPKTGLQECFYANDDGNYHAGWWVGRLYTDNKARFVAKSVNGADIVIDRATGLTWAARLQQLGGNATVPLVWNDALDYAHNLDFAGFTDWRIPNILELLSIINFDLAAPAIYIGFFYIPAGYVLWSSTTYQAMADKALLVLISTGIMVTRMKTGEASLLCVRGGV